jgi:hypothetical protein
VAWASLDSEKQRGNLWPSPFLSKNADFSVLEGADPQPLEMSLYSLMTRTLSAGPEAARKLNLNAILFVDSRGRRSCCLETQQRFGLQFKLPARCSCICAETERASACGSYRSAASSCCKGTDDRAGCSTDAGLSSSIPSRVLCRCWKGTR